jgi:putative resolvase
LIRWVHAGLITGNRPNPNGKWFFDVGSVEASPSNNAGGECRADAVDAIYARVSTRKQLNDLESQIKTLTTKYPDHVIFRDCASGLNFKRKGLLSLLQLAFEGRLRLVRIAHRDRLCRFAFDLLEYVFLKHGAKIHVEASDLPSSAESELAEDVLAVITVFGARLLGARSAGRRRKPPSQGEEKSLG